MGSFNALVLIADAASDEFWYPFFMNKFHRTIEMMKAHLAQSKFDPFSYHIGAELYGYTRINMVSIN